MNAGTSINKPNLARALALSSLLVAVATVSAQDKPAPAILRRSPASVGVTAKGPATKPVRPVRIEDSAQVEDSARIEDSNSADVPPPETVDRQVVPASDTTGVNRVRIRAVDRPADGIPGVARRTAPSQTGPSRTRPTDSYSRPATTGNPATARITSDDPTPAQTSAPYPSTTQPSTTQSSTSQVANRLPPLGRAIGTPPASAPLRTGPMRSTASAQAQATIASDQDSAVSSNAAVASAPTATGSRRSSRTTAKTTAPKESSSLLTRGMAYFDPTKLMPWGRPNHAESDSASAAEAESVVIDDGTANTSVQASPKPKVAQKAKKRSSKPKSADVAASPEGKASSSSGFFNPLKSVRQIWSGTEPPAPKNHRTAKANEPVTEQLSEDAGEEMSAPEQKPSMLAQLFGRNRGSEKAPLIKKPKGRVAPPEDSEVEIDSSEAVDEVAITQAPAGGHSLSGDEVTEVAETFQNPPPPVRPPDPRAANARLGAPIIELADEEIATAESDKVIR